MVRTVALLLAACMTVTGGCGTSGVTHTRPSAAQLAGITRFAVIVEGESVFDVMAARTKATGPGPVVPPSGGGGIPSAAGLAVLIALLIFYPTATAAAYGAAAAEDSAAAAKLDPRIRELSPGAVLVNSFTQALRSGGRFHVEVLQARPSDEERQRFDALVVLKFPAWGFQFLRTDTPSLTAFVDVDARMVLVRDGRSPWEQKERMLGHGRQTVDELKADPKLARRELRDTLETAGHRLAVDLLYPEDKP